MSIWNANRPPDAAATPQAEPVGHPDHETSFVIDDFLAFESADANGVMGEGRARPVGFDHLEHFVRIGIDSCFWVGEQKVFLTGWIIDQSNVIRSLSLRHGDQFSSDIRGRSSTYLRPDLNLAFKDVLRGVGSIESGFSTSVDFAVRREACDVHELEIVGQTAHGEYFVVPIADTHRGDDIVAMSTKLFNEFSLASPGASSRLAEVGRALQDSISFNYTSQGDQDVFVKNYGEAVKDPEVSVIVPLYGRFDFMEYQLSQFALDPDFQRSELIYVIDDPRIFEDVRVGCEDLYGIFQVPFRIVSSGHNQGFAAANNLGFRFSEADTVLLLNSDVMPRTPGWLSSLREALLSLDDAAAVAPILTFEDDSVQHCGIEFERHPHFPDLWINTHPQKGLPMSLVDFGDMPESVPAVTAACMMLSRERYEELGGLDEQYLLGDFEDSDLCLKGLSKGYRSYLIPSVSLYHLERKSQNLFEDLDWKKRVTLFNCWQHTTRWNQEIVEVMDARRAQGQPNG